MNNAGLRLNGIWVNTETLLMAAPTAVEVGFAFAQTESTGVRNATGLKR